MLSRDGTILASFQKYKADSILCCSDACDRDVSMRTVDVGQGG